MLPGFEREEVPFGSAVAAVVPDGVIVPFRRSLLPPGSRRRFRAVAGSASRVRADYWSGRRGVDARPGETASVRDAPGYLEKLGRRETALGGLERNVEKPPSALPGESWSGGRGSRSRRSAIENAKGENWSAPVRRAESPGRLTYADAVAVAVPGSRPGYAASGDAVVGATWLGSRTTRLPPWPSRRTDGRRRPGVEPGRRSAYVAGVRL